MWSWPCSSCATHGAQRLRRRGNGLCLDRSMGITPVHSQLPQLGGGGGKQCRKGEKEQGILWDGGASRGSFWEWEYISFYNQRKNLSPSRIPFPNKLTTIRSSKPAPLYRLWLQHDCGEIVYIFQFSDFMSPSVHAIPQQFFANFRLLFNYSLPLLLFTKV